MDDEKNEEGGYLLVEPYASELINAMKKKTIVRSYVVVNAKVTWRMKVFSTMIRFAMLIEDLATKILRP